MMAGRKLEVLEYSLARIYDGNDTIEYNPNTPAPEMQRWQRENIDDLIREMTGQQNTKTAPAKTEPAKTEPAKAKKRPVTAPAPPVAVCHNTEAAFLEALAWRDVEDGPVSDAKFTRCVAEMTQNVALVAIRAIDGLVETLAAYGITGDEAAHFYLRGPEVVGNIRDSPMLCEYFRGQKPGYPLYAPLFVRSTK